MRKYIKAEIVLDGNKGIKDIPKELLKNTGAWKLTAEPRSLQFTKDFHALLLKHELIDNEDDRVRFDVTIDS